MPTWRETAENLKAEMSAIVAKASEEKRDLTDDEANEIEAKATEHDALVAKAEKAEKAAERVREIAAAPVGDIPPEASTDEPHPGKALPIGEAFVASPEFQAWRKAHPSGIGSGTPVTIGPVKVGGLKALTTVGAFAETTRLPGMITPDNPPLTLLDLVTRGSASGGFEYVQVTNVQRNAAIVPEATSATDSAALKPVSDITLALADAKVYTYADGAEVTNQMLSDAPAVATYLNGELRYSVNNVVEDILLNGTGTAGQPAGILTTSGVQQQAFDVSVPRTLRQAILKVTRIGGQVTAVVLSPEDDAELDLMTDDANRYYGQGPFGLGPSTIWGRPRVVSERIAPGQAVLGDWRTVSLFEREAMSVLAFNQHADFARRNMTYVRAEWRGVQAIFKPAHLVIADLTLA